MARMFRLPTLPTLLTFAVAAALCAPASPAAAQGFGWFGNLFGGGAPRQQPAAPAYPGYAPPAQNAPNENYYARPRHAPRRKPTEQAQHEAPKEKTPPKNASVFVYVFGDSLGQQLATGLDDALADRSDVAVVHKARGSTGLVTADFYDWPKAISEFVSEPAGEGRHEAEKGDKHEGRADRKGEAERKAEGEKAADKGRAEAKAETKGEPEGESKAKIDVAVMMIGVNDRQPLQADGKTLQPGTPDWAAIYTKRVMQIDEAFRAKNIPLIWVGLPITKDDNFADDMAAFNDIYREAAAKTGAVYVDTWEAFSDDNGDFATYGPDVNGQTVRLRAADGIHFTRAGARKLAHFVETHVRRALEGKTPAPQLPTAEGPDTGKAGKAVATARPDVGPIRNLNEPPNAANGLLMSASVKAAGAQNGSGAGAGSGVLARGDAAPVPAGRADNAHWSGKVPAEP